MIKQCKLRRVMKEETKRRISNTLKSKNYHHPESVKRKISDSMRRAWSMAKKDEKNEVGKNEKKDDN